MTKENWNKLVNSLKRKSGGSENVTRVDIYECKEFDENDKLQLEGNMIYEIKY